MVRVGVAIKKTLVRCERQRAGKKHRLSQSSLSRFPHSVLFLLRIRCSLFVAQVSWIQCVVCIREIFKCDTSAHLCALVGKRVTLYTSATYAQGFTSDRVRKSVFRIVSVSVYLRGSLCSEITCLSAVL